MAMQKTKSVTIVGLIVLAILFLVINMVSNNLFTSSRIDLTENELYTLTDGTRNIVNDIDEPVTVYLFYSDKASEGVPQLRIYATRVKELLKEYEQLSNGNVALNIVDPVPFSEEEDQAASFGLQAIPVGTGDNIYFGLAASNAVGDIEVIPFFQPQREQFLEYDVSKLLYNLTHPKKTVVGLITQLPMFGGFDIETTQMTKEWAIIAQMRQLFELKQLDITTDVIDEDVDLLMVVHPKNLSEPTQYAIDQFVMRGGKAMFFVDPHSEIDTPVRQQNSPLEVEGGRTSSLKRLFDAWGIEFDTTKVVLDRKYALTVGGGQQEARHYGLLAITNENIDSEDVTTSELEVISMGVAGAISAKESSSIQFTPIVTSSDDVALIDASRFRFLPDLSQLSEGFEPTGEPFTFIARVQGKLQSAFKQGRPMMSDAQDVDESKYGEHLEDTKEDANLFIVADTDMLSDRMWVQVQEFFGQQIFNAWANNGDLVINTVDNYAGSSDLIGIRGRETSTRPFELVNDLRLAADQKFRSKEQRLQSELAETEQKLVELQKARDDSDELVLSPEQEAEIKRFQQEKFKVRKELRQVRHSLNQDIENLGTKLKFINIGLVPIIISIFALILLVIRSRKRKRALGV